MNKKLLFFSVLLLFGCKSKVETTRPTRETISESIYASGIVKSKNQYDVFSRANGIIDQIFVQEGDFVKVGTPILSISNQSQKLTKENAALLAEFNSKAANQAKLTEALQALRVSKSKMKIDSLAYARQMVLWRQEAISKTELEQVQLRFENSNYAYLSAVTKYDELKRQLDFNASQSARNLQISNVMENDYLLKSEINGVVYNISKSRGEMVSVQTPLAVIGDAKNYFLEMQVDEKDIIRIKLGLRVLVALDSYKGQSFEAKVSKIIPYMNERTRTFLVEAEFVNQPPVLYPNTTFEANILIQTKMNALLIPRDFLFNDEIVYDEEGKEIKIKTGLKDYRKVEILTGIDANTVISKPEE
jgi:multidrug efflux pump subunit AcrA (membrane-fusion protein)